MHKRLQDKKAARQITTSADVFLLKVERYLSGLLVTLDSVLDKRLVRTFFDLFVSIIRHRNRSFGLVLSELGAYVLSPQQAPAGTKRISNLLRSKKWDHGFIMEFLLGRARKRAEELNAAGETLLLLWDDSVVEKPESWYAQGLCSVTSSKGKRLTKIKSGYYTPPKAHICVPGFQWSAVLMTTLKALPSVVCMRWWTTRGVFQTDKKSQFIQMLKQMCKAFTQPLVHILDRGYADTSIILRLLDYQQLFILRWPKKFNLADAQGKIKNTWQFSTGQKHLAVKIIWDAPRQCYRRITLLYFPVTLPKHPDKLLYLVICRNTKHGQEPLYLLTNCNIQSKANAWKCIFSYMRRWSIEQAFRFNKSELALESPRLWFWENRLKIMFIVALIYDFLLQFLKNWESLARLWINYWCPRTGKRHSDVQVPLHRLRIAIVFLLDFYLNQNSG